MDGYAEAFWTPVSIGIIALLSLITVLYGSYRLSKHGDLYPSDEHPAPSSFWVWMWPWPTYKVHPYEPKSVDEDYFWPDEDIGDYR